MFATGVLRKGYFTYHGGAYIHISLCICFSAVLDENYQITHYDDTYLEW